MCRTCSNSLVLRVVYLVWSCLTALCVASAVYAINPSTPTEPPVIKAHNRYQDPYLLHSIPKCGSHLIQRLTWFLTGRSTQAIQTINCEQLKEFYKGEVVAKLSGAFSSDQLKTITQKCKYKLICMVRDPRDALVSHVFYMRKFAGKGNKRDFFTVNPGFDALTFNEQLTSLITGSKYSPSYLSFYQKRAAWALSGHALIVYFEDLVGSQGGGSDAVQRQTIAKVTKYINMNVTNAEIQAIQQVLYRDRPDTEQDGKTFERGSIGNWKTFLTEEHKALFKKDYGQLLIKMGYEKDLNW